MAERVGFEPTWDVMPPTDFESVETSWEKTRKYNGSIGILV